jgi:hypothetical protein
VGSILIPFEVGEYYRKGLVRRILGSDPSRSAMADPNQVNMEGIASIYLFVVPTISASSIFVFEVTIQTGRGDIP